MKKILGIVLIIVILLFVVLVIIKPGQNSSTGNQTLDNEVPQVESSFSRVLIENDRADMGFGDPSVEYGEGTTGWLSYTAVDFDGHLQTHIARSDDFGASWQFVQKANKTVSHTLQLLNGESVEGVFKYEVSSLVYDPTDPGREWKLFAHNFFTNGFGENKYAKYGWITYQHANSPDGTWSEPERIFRAGDQLPDPYNTEGRQDLNAQHPDLEKNITYTEPGVAFYGGVLYMSLTGLVPSFGGAKHVVYLLKSDDNAQTWQYVSTLLTPKDAEQFGHNDFDGTQLVVDGGEVFLFASPHSSKLIHDGTFVFRFENIKTGTLAKTNDGSLEVYKYIHPNRSIGLNPRGAGQSDYHEKNTNGGIIMHHFNMDDKPVLFQLYNTGEMLR